MSDTIRFLTPEMVLAIHERVLADYGGISGLRDRGVMESAVFTPAATFGGELLHQGLPAMAAAYLYHLCKNHPFVDGNKRAALAASIAFLGLNCRILKAEKDAVEQLTLGVADGSVSKDAATAFFQKHVRVAPAARPPSHRKRRNGPSR